jgi:hypothetical protein
VLLLLLRRRRPHDEDRALSRAAALAFLVFFAESVVFLVRILR